MNLAILIMAHKFPNQVANLCNLLTHEKIAIYIHIDKKVDIQQFKNVISNHNVYFIKNRSDTQWGGFSIIETIINSYKEILNNRKYDYICNISGQDLPIKSCEDLIEYISLNSGKEFIENIPYSNEHTWWKENKIRVEKYSFVNQGFRGKYRVEQILNRLSPKRKPPHNYTFSGNSGWFCLSYNAVIFLLSSYQNDIQLVRFFKYVWGADEIYFSTVLYNSPFREQIFGNLVYTVWQTEDKLHPKTFRIGDENELHNSNKFFARKFDPTIDQNIIDQISNYYNKS